MFRSVPVPCNGDQKEVRKTGPATDFSILLGVQEHQALLCGSHPLSLMPRPRPTPLSVVGPLFPLS